MAGLNPQKGAVERLKDANGNVADYGRHVVIVVRRKMVWIGWNTQTLDCTTGL